MTLTLSVLVSYSDVILQIGGKFSHPNGLGRHIHIFHPDPGMSSVDVLMWEERLSFVLRHLHLLFHSLSTLLVLVRWQTVST